VHTQQNTILQHFPTPPPQTLAWTLHCGTWQGSLPSYNTHYKQKQGHVHNSYYSHIPYSLIIKSIRLQCSKLWSVNGQFPDASITCPIILPRGRTKWLIEIDLARVWVCQRVVAMVLQPLKGGCYWPKVSTSGSQSTTKSWILLHGIYTPSSIIFTWTSWHAQFVLISKISLKACIT